DRRSEQGGGYRTTALIRAAVSSLKIKRPRKEGKKRKTKGAGARWVMQDVNAYSERFFGSRTPCEETCIIIGALITLFRSTVPYNFG
ncbi:hypothetical protein KI387_015301, partial [Taxus chinensis]